MPTVLELEAYPGFTEAAIGKIADEARARWALHDVDDPATAMDPSGDFSNDADEDLPIAVAEPVRADDTVADDVSAPSAEDLDIQSADETEAEAPAQDEDLPSPAVPFESVMAAIGDIEEIEAERTIWTRSMLLRKKRRKRLMISSSLSSIAFRSSRRRARRR